MKAGLDGINIYQCSRRVVDEACLHVNQAVVFLDDSSAELIHWHGGATTMFNAGALDVREFSSFEVKFSNDSKRFGSAIARVCHSEDYHGGLAAKKPKYKDPYHICVPTGRHLPDHSHGGLAAMDPTFPLRPGGLGAELRPASVPTRVPTDSNASTYYNFRIWDRRSQVCLN
jgi:hypothetical protein